MAGRRQNLIEDVFPQMFTPRRSVQIIAGCLIFLSVLAGAIVLKVAKPVMLPLTAAFIISVILAPVMNRLQRWSFAESVAAALTTLTALAAILSLLYFSGRPAVIWAERIPELAAEAREKLQGLEEAVSKVQEVSEQVGEIAEIGDEGDDAAVAVETMDKPAPLTSAAPSVIIQFLFTWVLVFFLMSARTDFKRKIVAAHRSLRGQVTAVRMFNQIEHRIGSYMLTMVCINAGLGACMALAAYLLGLPSPHIWGLLAALLNFVPYIGPAVLTVLLGLAGIVHYDDPWMAVAPMGAFILLNFVESNVATPMIVGVRMRVTPIAIIISVSFLTFLWGPVGGLLAIPLLLVFKTVCDANPLLAPVSILIGELSPIRRRPFPPAERRVAANRRHAIRQAAARP